MNYLGFTIRQRTVQRGKTLTLAYEVIQPATEHVLGIFPSEEKAKKAIEKNGARWV